MAVKASRVNVTSAATAVNSSVPSTTGQKCMVRNRDLSASIFLGGANVTTATGFEVLAGEAVTVDLQPGDALFAIAATGSIVCHVLETGT